MILIQGEDTVWEGSEWSEQPQHVNRKDLSESR